MNRIIFVNLTNETVKEEHYDFAPGFHYGKGLAAHLVKEYVPVTAGRYDEENCIILATGLFSGAYVPSTGRLTMAAKKARDSGHQFINLPGPFSQKLASLNITAVVISGKAKRNTPAVLNISESEVRIMYIPDLKKMEITDTVRYIRREIGRGKDTAIIGIGPAGEKLLPIAAVFSTYPEGIPLFSCVRGGMGDVLGSKGLKAIAVTTPARFASRVVDQDAMKMAGKRLSKIIVEHPICGGALPAYGSITLMKIMKSGGLNFNKTGNCDDVQPQSTTNTGESIGSSQHINRTCAPLCVIGCLNRHTKGQSRLLSSPAESEVAAALQEACGIADPEFASELNKAAFEQGIDSVEFVFTCALFSKLQDLKIDQDHLMSLLQELKKLTFTGRLLGSKTAGVFRYYEDRADLRHMVSRPSVSEEKRFDITMPFKAEGSEQMDDRQYLYASMNTFSNMGICLFASFALIESKEAWSLLAEMFYHKTGLKVKQQDLINYAINCLKAEEEYEKKAKLASIEKGIPEFVKVLYRYYGREVDFA